MKLRISGNSVRLRVRRSELAKLMAGERVAETVHMGSGDAAALTYALLTEAGSTGVRLRYERSEIVVLLPQEEANVWAATDQVGIYASIDVNPHGSLEVIVEKDFACLDLSDAENVDTFPNPELDAAC
jgi:tRNA A58 N-methylase Trm61